jgi:signal transduction histidine kinase
MLNTDDRQRNPPWIALAVAALLLVGLADYLTGFELSFSSFYLVPVSVATWFRGRGAGAALSLLSVVGSLVGDLASGARYDSAFVPWWNVLISLSFYLAMVAALDLLRGLHRDLERRVRERTSELRTEIAERRRLETALLEAGEREQRRIGHDLHDSLCQHLTGAALAGQVLAGKLESRSPDESGDARRLVSMIEEGIGLARSLARGLAPIDLDVEGLMAALHDLAVRTEARGRVECRLEMPEPVLLKDAGATIQLFRIAQEAVRNAARHSGARRIGIGLAQHGDGVRLWVEDDGVGLPMVPTGDGMGLHIMRHRADTIGADFVMERLPRGGTHIEVTTHPKPA